MKLIRYYLISSLFVFTIKNAYTSDFPLSPIFNYGDFQSFDEITNLAQSNELVLEPSGDHGYRVFSTRKYYLTAGVQLLTSLASTTGYVSVGLAPLINTYTKWNLYFENKKKLEEFNYDVPIKKEAFLALNNGDAVYWNSNAGLMFNVSVGVGVIGVGPKVSIEGGHSVYLERKSETEFYLELRRNNLYDMGIIAGSYVGYASIQYMIEKTQGLSFLIDISRPEGAKRLQEILSEGKIDVMLTDSGLQGVSQEVRIGDVSSLKKLKGGTFSIGTPFFPILQFSKSKSSELLVEDRSNIWNSKTRLEQALARREKSTRILKKQYYFEEVALVEKLTDLNSGEIIIDAQLWWSIKNNRSSFTKIRKYLEELNEKTEILSRVSLIVPNVKAALGSAKVSFELRPGKALLEKIIQKNNLDGPKKLAKFLHKAWANRESFKDLFSLVEACGGSWGVEIAGKELTKVTRGELFQEDLNCDYLR